MRRTSIDSGGTWSAREAGFALAACVALAFTAAVLAVLVPPASAARAGDLDPVPAGLEASPAVPAGSLSPADPASTKQRNPREDQTPTGDRLLGSGMCSQWNHVRQVIAWLRYRLPPRRVVYQFGGSAARESVISERSWSAQLRALSGRSAAAYVVSSSCQTFVQDTLILNQLPQGRGVALISVGTSRFSMLHESASLPEHSTRSVPPGPWSQHHYDRSPPLSAAQKRDLVRLWIRDRYGVFVACYPDRLVELDALIQTCLARGVRPVLLEMPLNLPVIGDAFDDARAQYQKGCLALAAKYDIKYVRFVSKIGLRGTDFYDLRHLLPPGRRKWQTRLSRELVLRDLLEPLGT